jgi:hypothetical protein
MLTQVDYDGQEIVVACASWSNNKMGAKYNSYERESLVVVWVVSSFKSYFYGSPFTLVIDHRPFNFFMESIISQESWPGGHLSSRNMILMYCIELVELIEMPMG